jgi:hypothetical protein
MSDPLLGTLRNINEKPYVELYRFKYTINYFSTGFVVCMTGDDVNEGLNAVFTFCELYTLLSCYKEKIESE